jgi:hypothetical protein
MPRKNKIIIRTGSGAPSASDFVAGEPGWDSANGKLYIRNAAGTMVDVTGSGGSGGGTTDVYEYASESLFPATGAANTIYIDKDTSRAFRWTDSVYVEIGSPGGSGVSKTLHLFTPRDNQPPATNFATLDTRNSILVLEFDAATEESAYFVGVVDDSMTLTNGLTVRLWWMADTATSGNVRWGVQFEKTGTDMDANSFDTNAQATSAANGTSGVESVASITITSIDSLTAGDRYRLRVYRVAADATNDTMTGDAQLVAVELRAA